MKSEQTEAPLDTPRLISIRHFGRSHITSVELPPSKNPDALQDQLVGYIKDGVFPMQFTDRNPPLRKLIYNAVLDKDSQQYKMFRRNLDSVIWDNFMETGHDPRLDGPPDHIKNQTY